MISWEKETGLKFPECDSIPSLKLVKGEEGTLNIEFFCENDKDDVFAFKNETGFSDECYCMLSERALVVF